MTQQCTKCKFDLTVLDPQSGWGVKFNDTGVCETCSARSIKNLEALKALAETKKAQKVQRQL